MKRFFNAEAGTTTGGSTTTNIPEKPAPILETGNGGGINGGAELDKAIDATKKSINEKETELSDLKDKVGSEEKKNEESTQLKSEAKSEDKAVSNGKPSGYSDTLGTHRVHPSSNEGSNAMVDEARSLAVYQIDALEKYKNSNALDGEQYRAVSEAQTRLEDAAMWVVKALTKSARK